MQRAFFQAKRCASSCLNTRQISTKHLIQKQFHSPFVHAQRHLFHADCSIMRNQQTETLRVTEARNEEHIGKRIKVQGWVRSVRSQKQVTFIDLNDGSSHNGLQIVITSENDDNTGVLNKIQTGSAIGVEGNLIKSPAQKQATELQVDSLQAVHIIGECDAATYPMQKKGHSVDFLRENAHLRSRTNTGSAMIRIRNEAMMAVHEYFQSNHFYHVHTPILTGSDCEGAGEQFRVLTDHELESVGTPQEKEASFFGTDVYLTVSGQLEAEIFATSMSRVYTFGPTFRAEPGKTSRHLAEFWMVEMEQSFVDLPTLTAHGENLVKHAIKRVMEKCPDELAFFGQWHDKELKARLDKTLNSPFNVITYTEAIDILQKSKEKFEFPTDWGCNLQSEHEVYICKHFGGPTFVTHYPKQIKPFYARVSSTETGRETVAAFDLLVPKLGELIGGSQREERYDVLVDTLQEKGMNVESYKWYLDLRQYGSVPHGGFGIGFERLILYLTGVSNIREAIPLPRAVGYCKF